MNLQAAYSLHDIVAKFLAGAAGVAAGYLHFGVGAGADIQCGGQLVGFLLIADVGKQQYGGAQHAAGVGVNIAAFGHHAGGRTMDGLKHGVALANVGAAGSANTALEFGSFVGDDVAVQVGQHKHLEVAAALFVDQLGGCQYTSHRW